MKKYLLLIFTLFVFSFPFTCSADSSDTVSTEENIILIIHSYHQDFLWTKSLHSGITDSLDRTESVIYIEYLDSYRKDSHSIKLQTEQIIYNYSKKNIQAIVVTDNDAYNMITDIGDNYFKGTPILFTGLNNIPLDQINTQNATGIMQTTDLSAFYNFVTSTLPEMKNIVVCGADTSTSNNIFEEIIEIDSSFVITYNISNSLEDQFKTLDQFSPKDTLIYVAGSFGTYNHNQYAMILEENGNFPTFAGVSSAIDGYVIGGYVIDPYEHGQIINEMLLSLLKSPSSDLPPIITKPVQKYIFNYSGLTKYHINDAMLPEDSLILNKPNSTIAISKTALNIIVLSLIFTVSLLGILIYSIRLKNRYTKELLITQVKLTESNMDLEAHTEELIASQDTLDQQFKQLQRNKNEIENLANFNQLTSFMNTPKFISELDNALSINEHVFVIYLIIRNIEDIAHSLGYDVYESLLGVVSTRIRNIIGQVDHGYGVIHGDDFLIYSAAPESTIDKDLNELTKLFSKPFNIDFISVQLTAVIGVSHSPKHSSSAQSLIKKASLAAMSIVTNKQISTIYYENYMEVQALDERKLKAEIDIAIKEKQFIMYYQPKMSLDGTTLKGLEALIRWQMPNGTLRYPNEFINLAEKTGQIIAIGNLVIDMVCEAIHSYSLDSKHVHVAINLSAQHFENDILIKKLNETTQRYSISNDSVELEITETSLINDFGKTRAQLTQLQQDGFSIALDDFGTGYSSLSYIQSLPINKIKIDRSFISKIPDENYMKVLKSVVGLSKDLNYLVTVEGIETKEQWDILKQFAPDELQGYYFSKPIPIEAALKFL